MRLYSVTASPPTPIYSRKPNNYEREGRRGDREREKDKEEKSSSAQVWRMLSASLAKCGSVHVTTQEKDQPVGSVPQSADRYFPLLRSHFSMPPSPIPTITAGKIRPPRRPGCSLAVPSRSQSPAPSVDHKAQKTLLLSTTEEPGMGQG